jgi:hypothetical protein
MEDKRLNSELLTENTACVFTMIFKHIYKGFNYVNKHRPSFNEYYDSINNNFHLINKHKCTG